MGVYHPNPDRVAAGEIGRVLEDRGDAYEDYTGQLAEGEQLWLSTHNGSWPLVLLVDHPEEFLYVTSHRGGKGPYQFLAIPEA